jgi:hypothetical protein
VLGADPLAAYWSKHQTPAHPCAGLLGEQAESGWTVSEALWATCAVCGRIGVVGGVYFIGTGGTAEGSITRPCGHYAPTRGRLKPVLLKGHWAVATNETQWHPADPIWHPASRFRTP